MTGPGIESTPVDDPIARVTAQSDDKSCSRWAGSAPGQIGIPGYATPIGTMIIVNSG